MSAKELEECQYDKDKTLGHSSPKHNVITITLPIFYIQSMVWM